MTSPSAPLPAARESESQVIGSCLLDPSSVTALVKLTRPRDYVDPAHAAAATMLVAMHRRGDPIDWLTLKSHLDKHPQFANGGSGAYLAEVGESTVTAAHAEYHARIVADASLKRRLALAAVGIGNAARNGHSGGEALTDALATLEDIRADAEPATYRFQALDAAELDGSTFEVKWLIDYVVAQDQDCIFAGGKKCLKTTGLVDMGISIATGGEFLDRFPVRNARSFLLCSGESGLATLQETSRRVAAAKGWHLRDVPNYAVCADLPRLDSLDDLMLWESFVAGRGADVVAVDPAFLCMPGDGADNLFKTGALLANMARVSRRLGITTIICHHTKKNRAGDLAALDPPELEDIAWSGFQEYARQWILIGRRERYIAGTGEHRLWLNYGGSLGHSGLQALDINEGIISEPGGRFYEVSVAKPCEARDDAQQRQREAKARRESEQLAADHKTIVDTLAGMRDEQGTKTDVRDRTNLNSKRFGPALASALNAGDIVPMTITKANKQTYDGFKLCHPDSPGLSQ